MAAPTFVGAGTGVIVQTGSGAVLPDGVTVNTGDLLILQVLQDGVAAGAIVVTPAAGVGDLAGTASSILTVASDQPCGSPTLAKQHLYAGRKLATGTVSISVFTSGDDAYCRIYVFRDAYAGSALSGLYENSTAGSVANGVGSTAAVADTGVTTLGPDRLALQFVAVDDDNPLAAFTGMTGGTWAEAVAEFASATGTDGAIQLQTALMAAVGTINGGSFTMAAADNWGVVGFALRPLLNLNQETYRFRNDDGNETTATWRQAVNTPDTIALDTTFRLRFAIGKISGDTTPPNYQLQVRRKPSGGAFGAWENVDTDSVGVRPASSPNFTSALETTQQISSGTFSFGRLREDTGNVSFLSQHTPETKTEIELTLSALSSAGATADDTYEFRVTLTTAGTPFLTYTQTPSLTIGAPSGTAHTATPADTLSLSDSATTASGKTATIADTLTLADATSSAAVFARTITDPVALADSTAFQRDVTLPLADTLTLADLVAAQRGIAQAVADTLTLADLATTAAGKGVTLADTLALADSLSSAGAFQRAIADTLSLADTIAAQSAFQLSIVDTLSLADALSSQAAFVRALADTLTLADLADPVKGVGGVDHAQPIADVVALADALTAGSTLARAVADTLALTDSLTVQRAILRDLADTLGLADAIRFDRALGLTDTVALADAGSFQAVYLRTLADTLSLADAVTAGRELTRALADTVALLDSLAATLGRAVTLEDVLALADQLDALLTVAIGEPPRASGLIDFPGIGTITRPTHGARVGNNRGNINTAGEGVLTKPTRGATS